LQKAYFCKLYYWRACQAVAEELALALVVEEESEELPVLLSDFLVELFAGLSFEEHSVDLSFVVEPEPFVDWLQ
jgi:hypothetical protein